ncbi:penicillin-binding transpeptidase domain-containing protein [Corynebacterium freiburgense]|uniref:penicillin-binding transpeptidase domain-containing protein n=1 Tax=Corynebacterium freiburgense TaxID=556548 RepID=UPI00040D1446|nr:penicillin-binding transpeptidase domain-containing protein [Corynebacterium freiburgense]WJZ03003.1 Beta-lactam-inducible penicillin-binding protein [Corynebacterium freiburgense]
MKRVLAIASLVGLLAASACTPKPDLADPVVADFLAAVARGDMEIAANMSDQPDIAGSVLADSWAGMQAEGLTASIERVHTKDSIATATYTLTWDLPKDRTYSYTAEMTLSQTKGEWAVRWQPTLLHPKLGANQHLELRAIPAERAKVISSDGAEILSPGVVYRLLLNPTEADNITGTATRIANALDDAHRRDNTVPQISSQELAAKLSDVKETYSVAVLNEVQGKIIKEELRGVPGITLNAEAAMVRANPDFAPDIVSRVEKVVNKDLEGANGWQIAAVNPHGALIDDLEVHAPQPAPAVRISIDYNIQQAAQQAVDMRKEMKAMLVAIRPSTGEILAVAQTKKADEDGDIALMGQYPPGSTFKIITAAAGVMHEELTPDSIVPCPGTMEIGHRIVTNYNQFSRGNVPMDTAFAASCNTSFADISSRLEPGRLENVAKQFGLGLDYEIEGFNTLTGDVPDGKELVDRVEAGFGQGKDLASPFGMALVAATAANGKTPKPYLVPGHTTKVSEEVEPPSPEAIAALQRMMRSVVTSGTARGMGAQGEIRGKTGEAEISGGSHAWFAGYRDDVAFATLVVLGGGSESAVGITDHFFRQIDQPTAPPQ